MPVQCLTERKKSVIMIKSFKCRKTEKFYDGYFVKEFSSFDKLADEKLFMLENAHQVIDLRSPPGNRLESLKGDRKGQYSIRINKRWRLCFIWENGNASEVEIVDYH